MTEASHYAAKRRAELMATAMLALNRAAAEYEETPNTETLRAYREAHEDVMFLQGRGNGDYRELSSGEKLP